MIRWKLMDCHCGALWTLLCLSALMPRITNTLTVDNQLVSTRSDCFERIALEAMMPFEKTYRTEDTNSLRMCKEKCLQDGDKCQSLSFGVHRRGNGTCQLSKEKYGSTSGRPSGVIFDPDFDLYVKQTNCFDLNQADNLAETNGYGTSLAPTTPLLLSNRPSPGTTILVVDPTPQITTTIQEENTRYASPTSDYGETTIFTHGSPTTLGPTPTTTIQQGAPNGNADRLYFSHDVYPLFKYPTLYEPNYPAPNQDVYIPGGYAANAQEVSDRPTSYDGSRPPPPPPPQNPNGPPRPMFGLGYGNGYSYGTPESYNPSTNRPQDSGYSPNSQRPNMNRDPTRPGTGYENSNRDPNRMPGYDNTTPSHYPRPSSANDSPYGPRPSNDHSSATPPYGARPENSYSSSPPYGPRPENSSTPPYGPRPNDNRGSSPSYGSRPDDNRGSSPSYGSRPDDNRGSSPAYAPRPENGHSSSPPPYGTRPSSHRPGDFVDYTNRPDAPLDGSPRPPPGAGNSYDTNYNRRNGTAISRPGGYPDDKKINTYFNPEDYMPGNKKRPGSMEDNEYTRQPMKEF